MFAGVGFHSGVRWGDYTRTDVDPSDGLSFWHINQYAQSSTWHTRIGKFKFPTVGTWSTWPNLPTGSGARRLASTSRPTATSTV